MAHRIEQSVNRDGQIEIEVDGEAVTAYAGETLASVLLLQRKTAFYHTRQNNPRMVFCNMGTCLECRVTVRCAGGNEKRMLACMTPVEKGMSVTTGHRLYDELPEALRGD